MKSRIFGWMVMLAAITLVAAASLLACGESCLDQYPCNVPADDDSDASHDGGADTGLDAATTTDDAADAYADESDAADD